MTWHLFVDGSSHPSTNIGYGAMLLVEDINRCTAEELLEKVKCNRFYPTSSSKLELQCFLWALEELGSEQNSLNVYSDSQLLVRLPTRRDTLVSNDFCSTQGKPFALAGLYRKFFDKTEQVKCNFIQLKGHKPSRERSAREQVFKLVDKASRSALRAELRRD